MRPKSSVIALSGLVLLLLLFVSSVASADELRMTQVAAANPCNPCAMKNPCMGNPCAAKKNPCNPCGMKNPCNPCAAKNPCNPCAAKNPCGMAMNPCNPCGAKNPCGMTKNPCNPCAAKNPCGMAMNPCNPCGAMQTSASDLTRPVGSKRYRGERSELVKYGKELWTDTSLSTNGLSCNSCHMNNLAFLASFTKQYPHEVAMAKGMGIHSIQIDEMVQLCMVNPMANKPLPWDSRELASLSAYSVDVAQRNYVAAVAANPCMAKASNPCNPCGAAMNPCNPCAAKMNPCNPCAAKMNPCNPCATKMNPCNPCAMQNPCARH